MPDDQRQLFDMQPEPWEADDQAVQLVATVVLSAGGAREFDYAVPDAMRDEVEPGRRVKVPLGGGNRTVIGYCIQVENKTVGRPLKSLQAVLDHRSLLSPAMLRLTRWIAEHYLCDWAQVLDAVVPAGVRFAAGTRMATLLSVDEEAVRRYEEEIANCKLKKAKCKLTGSQTSAASPPRPSPPTPRPSITPKQQELLKLLARSKKPLTPRELARMAGCTEAPITTLRRRGLIRSRIERTSAASPELPTLAPQENLLLNEDQQNALNKILDVLNSGRHRTILLHGVTGSGKTEVYIQAIQEVVRFGRQAIVLVPEISLTPQTVDRFRRRFGRVAVLHSHLSDADRHRYWLEIAEGRVSVIVGARSAIFAPTPHLGLIVLDEEHETSFKQESAPRYHARDVAVARAAAENIPLVLGSATPSLESWQRAKTGEYSLVEMPRRVLNLPMPMVGTIDLRMTKSSGGLSHGAISRQLSTAMTEALNDGGQVILLLNRRGFSTYIQCPACGYVATCPECDIALTHDRTEEVAVCHYCDYRMPAPTKCPTCDFTGIRYSGLGTQRLEAEVRARFPNMPCLRMDTDAMQKPGSHERALRAFRAGEIRILLGTQMIAKGLDFPNVTLVGVVNADTALHLPDFRAAERTFHLVTQVAGRTGRGPKGGRVLVQTFSPDHPAIVAAVHHDYAKFAAGELPIRQMLNYPPFSTMIRLVVRGPVEPIAAEFSHFLADRVNAELKKRDIDARVLGPAPCPFVRLRGRYRFQIQTQATDGDGLRSAVSAATANVEPPDEVQWIVDVDAVEML